MGPPPLTWGVRLLAGGCAKGPGAGAAGAGAGAGTGADGMDRPSNLGSWGAAAMRVSRAGTPAVI